MFPEHPSLVSRDNDSAGRADLKTMREVEIPLMVLAMGTVALRIYSRLAVKRKLAVDDGLIVLALVRLTVFYAEWRYFSASRLTHCL